MDDAADLPNLFAALLAAKALLLAVLAAILGEKRRQARRLNAELDRLEVQLRARWAESSDRNGPPPPYGSPSPGPATAWLTPAEPRRRGRRTVAGRPELIGRRKY